MTTPNAELAYKVLDHIDAHPEQWHQTQWISRPDGWDCHTAGCFAGWTCILSGDVPAWEFQGSELTDFVQTPDGTRLVPFRAAQLLGIDDRERDLLFDEANSRITLGQYVGEIFGPRVDT